MSLRLDACAYRLGVLGEKILHARDGVREVLHNKLELGEGGGESNAGVTVAAAYLCENNGELDAL